MTDEIWKRLRGLQSVAGLIVIILAAILLSPEDRRDGSLIFLSQANLTDILRQVSEIGILALAMTFVILTGGIDLSVGSLLALSASTVALLLTAWNPAVSDPLHIALAISGAIVLCGALGAVNGLVVARFRMQPFIVTLAAMIGVRGLARWLTDNTNIDIGFGSETAAVFAAYISQKHLVIGVFVLLAGFFTLVLARTVFGGYVRALGGNETASRLAGLPIGWIQVSVYTLSGLMAGIAGVIHCAQNRQGNPNDGVAYELEAIAAVVIGGTSLMGGKGSMLGTVVGALIMGVLTNLFRLRGVDANMEMMAKAVIIIAAVRLQQGRRSY